MRGSAVHFSVMRFRCFLRGVWWFGPGMAAAIATTMLFALTPCCEVNAAPSAAAHSGTDGPDLGAGHGDDHDHGTSAAPDPCLMWLDNNLNVLDTNAGLPIPERDPNPVLTVTLWLAPPGGETQPRLLPSCHPPPLAKTPLYLRVERLLI